MPSGCALLGEFAIGARVALLWQHKRTRNVSEYSEYMLILALCLVGIRKQVAQTQVNERRKKLNYSTTDLRQRSHPFY